MAKSRASLPSRLRMIEVYRIPVPKERLRARLRDERIRLLLLGYVSNQVLMFRRQSTRSGEERHRCLAAMNCRSWREAVVQAYQGRDDWKRPRPERSFD
jgi:hypothetical protein